MRTPPLELAVLALVFAQYVWAQVTDAQCEAGFDWMSNSKGQSPCLVAAYLGSPCSESGSAYIPALEPDHYYKLSKAEASNCTCSTVYYAAMSACGACQGREWDIWSGWAWNCTETFNSTYPNPIPPDTAVPAWAYMDVETAGAFNVTEAQAFAEQQLPESTNASPQSTSSASEPPSSTIAASAVPTQAATRKPNARPIIGGVVGGLGGLILLVMTLILCLRHRKAKKTPPSAQFRGTSQTSSGTSTTPWMPDYERRIATPGSVATTHKYYAIPQNHDDPTTFPETAHVPSMYSETSQRESTYFTAQSGYQPAGIHYRTPLEIG